MISFAATASENLIVLNQKEGSENGSLNRCGDCHACCTALEIPELSKPQNQPCQHLCGNRCSIYQERPLVCGQWECLWLQQEEDERFRPDNSNVLTSLFQFGTNEVLSIQVAELRKGAATTKLGREWVTHCQEASLRIGRNAVSTLPVCVVRYVPGKPIGERPVTWYVNRSCLFAEQVLQELRQCEAKSNSRYKCGRNTPCPFGSGLKFKRCHAQFMQVIVL